MNNQERITFDFIFNSVNYKLYESILGSDGKYFSAINYIHLSSKINNSKKIKIKIDMYNSDKKFKSSIIVNNEGLSKVHSYATLVFNDNLIK